MHNSRTLTLSISTLLLSACASLPTAPSVLALPGTGRSFDQFRVDDANCRHYAYLQIGGKSAEQAANTSGVATAALGTVIGAAAGAAMGGGEGAAVGAGFGLAGGSIAGAGTTSNSLLDQQERFDHAYVQCMYAQGHRVPVWGSFTESGNAMPAPPPPPSGTPPAPPGEVLNPPPPPR
jgi:hypothetical protein